MSLSRGQSSGWTAFDRKQRKKDGIESEADNEPFPAIGTSNFIRHDDKFIKKDHAPVKPFSSVLLPTINFPPLKEGVNNQTPLKVSDSHGKYCGNTAWEDVDSTIKKLKEQHRWADNSLIEDVLAAVNNDVDKAATLLETMTSAVKFEECNVPSDPRAAISYYIPQEEKTEEKLMSEKVKDGIPIHYTVADHDIDNANALESRNADASSGEKLYDDDSVRCKLGLLNFVPVEPEWEEDDIYLSHRKDALKTMRSASRHSKAAANAFLRGDHISARQHSMKAWEGWHTAEELNSEAATKILKIRNSENDIWKLDLHGLHTGEAIQALKEHLNRIESQGFFSKTSNSVKENELARSNLGSVNSIDRESLDKKTPIRLRSPALHVITGVGNHSRGQAALPTAVRTFLNENRYRFDEMRPGVITVWPKFRQS